MIEQYLKESIALQKAILKNKRLAKIFTKAVDATFATLVSGHKILAAGNGGSAADAQHFIAEFVGKYKIMRKAYSAIALTTDTSILTAWSNDHTFDAVFGRQIEALGSPGDIFFALSTSGNSKNIIHALEVAKRRKIATISLLGCGGGKAKGMADFEITVPSKNTPRIQEMHKLILHSIAEEVERRLSA
jgi:D-sedoheptulose 7-phosphate isomerase